MRVKEPQSRGRFPHGPSITGRAAWLPVTGTVKVTVITRDLSETVLLMGTELPWEGLPPGSVCSADTG